MKDNKDSKYNKNRKFSENVHSAQGDNKFMILLKSYYQKSFSKINTIVMLSCLPISQSNKK